VDIHINVKNFGPIQSRRDDMFIENEYLHQFFSPVGTICLFFYVVPTELKRG